MHQCIKSLTWSTIELHHPVLILRNFCALRDEFSASPIGAVRQTLATLHTGDRVSAPQTKRERVKNMTNWKHGRIDEDNGWGWIDEDNGSRKHHGCESEEMVRGMEQKWHERTRTHHNMTQFCGRILQMIHIPSGASPPPSSAFLCTFDPFDAAGPLDATGSTPRDEPRKAGQPRISDTGFVLGLHSTWRWQGKKWLIGFKSHTVLSRGVPCGTNPINQSRFVIIKVYNESLRLIDWFNPPLEKLSHEDDSGWVQQVTEHPGMIQWSQTPYFFS